jgi:pimeloyl-ACP methyl ester carboxylesterase
MASIVLIHGAYQGGWIWRLVAERLRAAGHDVHAPTLDGCAERRHQMRAGIDTESHGQEIAEYLYYHDLRDAVLVGTSAGGMVMAAAAERARDRIGAWFLPMRWR